MRFQKLWPWPMANEQRHFSAYFKMETVCWHKCRKEAMCWNRDEREGEQIAVFLYISLICEKEDTSL